MTTDSTYEWRKIGEQVKVKPAAGLCRHRRGSNVRRYRSVRPDDVAIRARLPELAILDDGFTYESIGRRAMTMG
jgi:hypothetical protein